MAILTLRTGEAVLLDDEDLPKLTGYSLARKVKRRRLKYVICELRGVPKGLPRVRIYLHRLVLGLENGDPAQVDHKNRDGLDCQKSNLRIATHKQNMHNRLSNTRSDANPYTGVTKIKDNRYVAKVHQNGLPINLGVYDTAELAAEAYDTFAMQNRGEFARTNLTYENGRPNVPAIALPRRGKRRDVITVQSVGWRVKPDLPCGPPPLDEEALRDLM
jgi:hypothetical protein